MGKSTFVTVKAKLSFVDKIKSSLGIKRPQCKSIIEQAEEIVEEYILNCRLQGITLYKKRKKLNVRKAAAAIVSLAVIAAASYLIFV